MSESQPRELVTVTGASGFIASHLVAQLLERGYRVRGTVRSLERPGKYQFLRDLPGADERLELVEGELLEPGSYDEAVDGAAIVFHTASPYAVDVDDPQRDLIDPALEGTRNVLGSCQRAGGVERVVLTSSMAAISDEPIPGHVFTEEDWNTRSTLDRNPYYLSKTLAERAAWEFVEDPEVGFDLVVINPYMVVGPSLTPSLNTSNAVLKDILEGTYPGIMDLSWGFVDVRDVARAHVLAAETPEAQGRYLTANTDLHMRQIVELLGRGGFDIGYKLPRFDMSGGFGTAMMRLAANFQSKGVRSFLKTHLGKHMRFDHGKVTEELGLEFRPLEDTILEAAHDLIRWGHLEANNPKVERAAAA